MTPTPPAGRNGRNPPAFRIMSLAAGAVLLLGAAAAPAATVSSATLETINAATFEVVVPKPEKDSLSYEKPLPLDLLPYTERTDKYHSVGTAFAIGPDRFVSAAHVMNLGLKTQYRGVYLRDRDGKVYGIDKIIKYSDRRDFIVFSLKGKTAGRSFPIEASPRQNEEVYAVGNALGEGVVIRDGLYTSSTPEEREGKWKWIRFSAAASPGNSGGPLLNKDGKAIGIVLRKSENENLNYALPISEVLGAKDNLAVVDQKIGYQLDNMDMTKMGLLQKEIPLPKAFEELHQELIKTMDQHSDKLLKELLDENKANIFPSGKGATTLLHSVYSSVFPRLIAKGQDGNWDAFVPGKTNDAELGANGRLSYGGLWHSLVLYLRKPDDVPLDRFYKDSKLFMDLMLKGMPATRNVGPEKIKITSLGKAEEEYVFTDSYKRRWTVRIWPIEYLDSKVVIFALPVPGGYAGFMRSASSGMISSHIADMKALSDFFYVTYYGTLNQWREYLAMKEQLPPVFATIKFSFDYGKSLRFESRRLSFAYDSGLMKITKSSELQLDFAYFNENAGTVWDVARIIAGEDENTGTAIVMTRNTKPAAEMDNKYKGRWDNISGRRHPFNSSAYFEDKMTVIGAVHAGGIAPERLASAPLLYTVVYSMDGNHEQKKMADGLAAFTRNFKVLEY